MQATNWSRRSRCARWNVGGRRKEDDPRLCSFLETILFVLNIAESPPGAVWNRRVPATSWRRSLQAQMRARQSRFCGKVEAEWPPIYAFFFLMSDEEPLSLGLINGIVERRGCASDSQELRVAGMVAFFTVGEENAALGPSGNSSARGRRRIHSRSDKSTVIRAETHLGILCSARL